jgi:aminoglycoside phosphotransferase (APT) family kinase protein
VIQGELEAVIAAAYPGRSDITISALAEIEHGWETTIYRFDLSYEEDGATRTRALVAKRYPGPDGGARAGREAAVLEAVGRAGLPVPRIELVSDRTLVMERAPGALLADQITETEVAGMARLLAGLHRVPVSSVFTDGLEPFSDPAFVEPDPAAMSTAIERFGLDDYRPLLDWLTRSPSRQLSPAVLHNDYHPENIIVEPVTGALTIVDWTFAGVGDPRLDLVWSALWTGAMAGSAARSKLLSAYAAAAGDTLEDLEHFEGLKLGSRLMTIEIWLDESVEPPVHKITPTALRGAYRSTVETVYQRFCEVTGLRLPGIEQL